MKFLGLYEVENVKSSPGHKHGPGEREHNAARLVLCMDLSALQVP